MGRSFSKKVIVKMAAVIELTLLWKLTDSEAPKLKIHIFIYRLRGDSVFLCQSAIDSLTADETPSCELHKVFSTSLNVATTWFALNSNLCSTKPSVFCSSSTAKLFPSEYACTLGGLERGRWFSHPFKVVFGKGVCGRCVRCDSLWNSSLHFKAEVPSGIMIHRILVNQDFRPWLARFFEFDQTRKNRGECGW